MTVYRYVNSSDGTRNENVIMRIVNGVVSCIPKDCNNRDWQAYTAWRAESPTNVPEPAW